MVVVKHLAESDEISFVVVVVVVLFFPQWKDVN